MATTSRQTSLFGTEDWKRLYKTFKEADVQSYNFETLRKTFVDYLRQNHPESFNDYVESSEFIALLDIIAFMGQSISFRTDLNTRENFMDTAERRDSVIRLGDLVGYTPKRNEAAKGYVKIASISTTESVIDSSRNNLGGTTINWDDTTNNDWQEQFTVIVNAALVNSQKIGQPGNSAEIVGIKTDEYQINMADGFLPVVPFGAVVDSVQMDFEIVNGTSAGHEYIYEPAPRQNGPLNMLYRNDNQGFASANTGFFFYFKQGKLQSQDFTLVDQIANRTIDIDVNGTNNDDVWLFKINDNDLSNREQWTEVAHIFTSQHDQLPATERKFFSVASRVDDQITLEFGDGVFSVLPIGTFRTYVRSSNGLTYVINKNEIQGVEIAMSYISKANRNETVTFTLELTTPVSNSKNKETIEDIKRRAPGRFYTQDRMVNGEDYNNFPYSTFGSIIKSKAINRSNIGASRYLDLIDPTGKYSSINTYGSDGMLYQDTVDTSFKFTFNDRTDIESVIINQVEPLIAANSMLHFYYANFPRPSIAAQDIRWTQSSTFVNETTGYFSNAGGTALPIGNASTSFTNDLKEGSLVKFVPPAGYHFSENNKIVAGSASLSTDQTEIWASIRSITVDGAQLGLDVITDSSGPVTINNFVPTGALPTDIILSYTNNIPLTVEQEIIADVELYRNVGIGYDAANTTWYVITHDNIDLSSAFSLTNAEDQTNMNLDASWLVSFVVDSNNVYTVTSHTLSYFFASVLETRFYHDGNQNIFDIKTGKSITDFIKLLKSNSKPDSNSALESDMRLDIIDQSVEADGFVNDFNVEVSFPDVDKDGIVDNPDFFTTFVSPTVNPISKLVFFELTSDFDNLERYLPVAVGVINVEFPTKNQIEIYKSEFAAGQIFYAYTEEAFYELVISAGVGTINARSDFITKVGRGNTYFQYRHNSPDTKRLNPGNSNIMDIYVVTSGYHDSYRNYIQDTTGKIEEPKAPSTDALMVEYSKLQAHRMESDNLIMNSVVFKPLFGNKADQSLQATMKVVRFNDTVTSDSEIKSSVVATMNEYFDINIWDFGDTFYFSELSAYLHSNLGNIISSVVITSNDATRAFGDLYEVRSAANEIFVNAATVDDVEIITALTASKLQIGTVA